MIEIKVNAPVQIGSTAYAIIRMLKSIKGGRFRKSTKDEDITIRPFIITDITISDASDSGFGASVSVFLSGPTTDGSMQYLSDAPAADTFVSMEDAAAELDRRLAALKEGAVDA